MPSQRGKDAFADLLGSIVITVQALLNVGLLSLVQNVKNASKYSPFVGIPT